MGSRSLDGWLQKLAKTTSSGKEMWQRRWFVLQGDTLSFFNSMDDAGGPPKWTIDLASGSTASVGSEATRIELLVGSEHVILKADSEVEAEMWISALATETNAPPPPSAGPPAMSAFSFMSAAPAEPAPAMAAMPAAPVPPAQPTPTSGVKKKVRSAKRPGSQDFDPDAPPAPAPAPAPVPAPAAPPPPASDLGMLFEGLSMGGGTAAPAAAPSSGGGPAG